MKKRGVKAPPKKPYMLSPEHPMNTERTTGMPKLKRGASKHHNFGQVIGKYSSEK
jgi:hypothetical protein